MPHSNQLELINSSLETARLLAILGDGGDSSAPGRRASTPWSAEATEAAREATALRDARARADAEDRRGQALDRGSGGSGPPCVQGTDARDDPGFWNASHSWLADVRFGRPRLLPVQPRQSEQRTAVVHLPAAVVSAVSRIQLLQGQLALAKAGVASESSAVASMMLLLIRRFSTDMRAAQMGMLRTIRASPSAAPAVSCFDGGYLRECSCSDTDGQLEYRHGDEVVLRTSPGFRFLADMVTTRDVCALQLCHGPDCYVLPFESTTVGDDPDFRAALEAAFEKPPSGEAWRHRVMDLDLAGVTFTRGRDAVPSAIFFRGRTLYLRQTLRGSRPPFATYLLRPDLTWVVAGTWESVQAARAKRYALRATYSDLEPQPPATGPVVLVTDAKRGQQLSDYAIHLSRLRERAASADLRRGRSI